MLNMDQLLEFTVNHWMLVLALAAIAGVLIQNLVMGSKGGVEPQEATAMINHQDGLVVDVRPMADFSQGHIISAINIPINGFKNQIDQLNKHKGKPIIISCRSGAQSVQACRQLKNAGFEEVYNLKGGMLAWQSANLPITKKQ
jgi:rhodanese-related sulfurtransferase